jgi:hypothetical protein
MLSFASPPTFAVHKPIDQTAIYSLSTVNIESDRFNIMAALGSRQLPMPNVTRITSLSQAHATLQHCWVKLSSFIQDHAPALATSSSTSATALMTEQRQHFHNWLEQWETAFTVFLTNAMATMNSNDITQSRILKANHLACTVLAAESSSTPLSPFETEFNAIVELSAAVLRLKDPSDSPLPTNSILTQGSSASNATTNLDVVDPLMLVISRCTKNATRTRAAELLRLVPR